MNRSDFLKRAFSSGAGMIASSCKFREVPTTRLAVFFSHHSYPVTRCSYLETIFFGTLFAFIYTIELTNVGFHNG